MAGQNNSERNGRKVHMPIAKAGRSKIHGNSVHNRESQKNNKCDLCGKSFAQSGVLNRHIAIHKVQKDHKCDACGKLFSVKEHLKKHIKSVHYGQKDHKCYTCGNV